MTQPALKVSKPTNTTIEEALYTNPPRLNERVPIYTYSDIDLLSGTFRAHCAVIRKCGLVAEVIAEDGKGVQLFAARRRPRNKHD